MYMRYLMDLVNMKKPKWYQLAIIIKNRRIISSAKFYIKTISYIDTVGELCNTTKDFMTTIEYLFLNGYNKDVIIPKHITTFKLISIPRNLDGVGISDVINSNYFGIEFSINGYTIFVSTKTGTLKAIDMNKDLNIDISYKTFDSIVPITVTINPVSKESISMYNKNTQEVFQYIKDFIEIVMLHVLKEITYLYQ